MVGESAVVNELNFSRDETLEGRSDSLRRYARAHDLARPR